MDTETHCRVILKKEKEQSVQRFHPWIFSGAIHKIEGSPKDGDIVEVYDNKANCLAVGHYQVGSIMIRIFSFSKNIINYDFWKQKFFDAYNLRKQLGLINNSYTNVYRLIYGEGDGMSGLIVDYYNGVVVLQAHSVGMYNLRNCFSEILKDIYAEKISAVYDKSSETLPKAANINCDNKYLYRNGVSENIVIENQNKFHVNIETGQKTGFFIDQRESRELLKKYVKDKIVLNTFCYTGGFSVYALNAGAKQVHSVDSSKSAIELTNHNVNCTLSFSPLHATPRV